MRVLIVHDRVEVAGEVEKIVRHEAPNVTIVDHAFDEVSARRSLESSIYDLMIVDLTLPHIAGRDAPNYENAARLLREVFILEGINTPGDIIGLTREAEALERVGVSIGPHVMAIISEGDDGDWRRCLGEKVQYARRAAGARQLSINSQYDYDCLIVTALDEELDPYNEIFELSEYAMFPGAYTFAFADKSRKIRRGVAYSVGKSGEARAASFTQSLLAIFRPRLALMTGFCGGVEGKVQLGDLVFAEAAIDWDYGKWAELPAVGSEAPKSVFRSRPTPISILDQPSHRVVRDLLVSDFLRDPSFLRDVARYSEGRVSQPNGHVAPMASGSAVVASDEMIAQIRTLNESIRGIDMECFGFYHAVSRTHVVMPQMICVKSVSDFSNGLKGDEYHRACAYIAARTAEHVVKVLWSF